MKKIILFPFLFFAVHFATAQSDFGKKEEKIDSLIRAYIIHDGKHPVHNFLIYAKNEQTGFEVYKGLGTLGRSDTPIDAEYQFAVASITKTLVATIILQLSEEGNS